MRRGAEVILYACMQAEEYSMWLRHLRRGSLDSRRIQIDMPMPAAAGPHGGKLVLCRSNGGEEA